MTKRLGSLLLLLIAAKAVKSACKCDAESFTLDNIEQLKKDCMKSGETRMLCCFQREYRSFNGTLQVFRGESLPNLSAQLNEKKPIQSPTDSESGNYYNETECVWIILSNKPKIYTLYFLYFDLEESDRCKSDYVRVRFRKPSNKRIRVRKVNKKGRFCDFNTRSSLEIKSEGIEIAFVTDATTSHRGFNGSLTSNAARLVVEKGNKLSNRRYGTITCSEPIDEKCFAKEGDDVTWRKQVSSIVASNSTHQLWQAKRGKLRRAKAQYDRHNKCCLVNDPILDDYLKNN